MRENNFRKIAGVVIVLLLSIGTPFLMVNTTYLVGPIIIGMLVSFLCLVLIFNKFEWGVYLLFTYGALFVFAGRILKINFPYGVPFDFLIILTFFAMLFYLRKKEKVDWKLNDPITISQIVFYGYFIIQIANPNSVSLMAWVNASRFLTLFILYFIFLHFFDSKPRIKYFTILWISFATVAGLYGISQEHLGLNSIDWGYVTESEERFKLFFIWGHMRVFSLFTDPSAFGLFMAFGGTATLVLSFGKLSGKKKFLLFILSIVMIYSMTFSGTRTAFALIVASITLFIIANISNRKVLIGSSFIVFIFIILMVGPFYSGPINRMRSTFNLSEDASMAVRDMKRVRLQAYVKSHPIGGGLNTAGNTGLSQSPGHPMAGKYDPDSGHLRLALEMGWIGLFLSLALYSTVIITGIINYFKLKNPLLRGYSLSYSVALFGLTVAHYAQDALFQKPINIIVVATYALMIKVKDIDNSVEETL